MFSELVLELGCDVFVSIYHLILVYSHLQKIVKLLFITSISNSYGVSYKEDAHLNIFFLTYIYMVV